MPTILDSPRMEVSRGRRLEMLRATFAGGAVGVDEKRRRINGVIIAQTGPFVSGRGEFDNAGLRKIVELGRATNPGLVANYGHHPDAGDAAALDAFLGRFIPSTVRMDGGDTARGDLQLADSAFLSVRPGISKGEYLLARAKEDPASLGSSLIVAADRAYRLDDRGRRQVTQNGEPLAPIWIPTAVRGCDIVAKGDATHDGLLAVRRPSAWLGIRYRPPTEAQPSRSAASAQPLASGMDLARERWRLSLIR